MGETAARASAAERAEQDFVGRAYIDLAIAVSQSQFDRHGNYWSMTDKDLDKALLLARQMWRKFADAYEIG